MKDTKIIDVGSDFENLPSPEDFEIALLAKYDPDIVETFVEHGASYLKDDNGAGFDGMDGFAELNEKNIRYRGDPGFEYTHGFQENQGDTENGDQGLSHSVDGLTWLTQGVENSSPQDESEGLDKPVPRNGNRLTPRTTPEATGPELPAPFQQPQIESGESSMQDLPTQVASQAIPRKNGTEVTMAMRRMARKKKLEILAEQKRMEQQELAAAAAREADENTMALTLREENFNSSDQHIDGVIWTPDPAIMSNPARQIMCCQNLKPKTKLIKETYGEHLEIMEFVSLFAGGFPMRVIDCDIQIPPWQHYRHIFTVNSFTTADTLREHALTKTFAVTNEHEVYITELQEIVGTERPETVLETDAKNGDTAEMAEFPIRVKILWVEFSCSEHPEHVFEISKLFYRHPKIQYADSGDEEDGK